MKLEFGAFDMFREAEMHDGPATADAFAEHIKEAQLAEKLGYTYYFFIEHQNAPFAYISSPNVYLAAMARETSTLRFGPMVYQLPMHDPMRLAQDCAMVDQLSKGRLEFGAGYGIHAHEFMRWKLNFSERREMGVELMEIVLKAWTEDSVTYEGEYWSYDEALPKPKPYQQPHPPVWVGAHSTISFDYAAKMNFHVGQNIDVDDTLHEKFAYWREKLKEYNHPGPAPKALVARHVHVAETDEQARAEAEPMLLQGFFGKRGGQIISQTRIGWGGDTRGTGGERTPDIDERGRIFQEMGKSYDFWIDNGLALVGSPDTVARKIEEQSKYVGYDVLATQHQIGDMSKEAVRKSMKLFGEKVIPAFK
jgi:alkanesulfonate monooxygenase SsuD/methylene tetrahydromethanopterin reductase-like flavin-dependent oxidoreductase (luciferase family)